MTQVERIRHMETIMEDTEGVLKALRQALEAYQGMTDRINELERYYSSPVWQQDYAADEAGAFPAELKRGVLSEDGIWNLLIERDSLRALMNTLGKALPEEE